MSSVLSPLVYQMGLGGIGGFIIGCAIKKMSKLIVVLLGLFIIFPLYLGTSGIIEIYYEELWKALASFLDFAAQSATWLVGIIFLLPFMGSLVTGLLLGFKLG